MFPGRTVITGMLVIAVIGGCTKKKTDREFSSKQTPAVTSPTSSQDIFDEFYKEDTASKTPKSAVSTEPEPARTRSEYTPSFSENGRYVVQVSTVVSRSLADAVSAQLSAKGYPSYVAEVQNPTPSLTGTYFRVRIGGFDRISAARSFGENILTAEGFEFWVDNRSNDNIGLEGYGMGNSGSIYSGEASSGSYQPTYTPEPAPATYTPEPEPAATYTPEPAPAQTYSPQSSPEVPSTLSPAPSAPAPATPAEGDEWGKDDW